MKGKQGREEMYHLGECDQDEPDFEPDMQADVLGLEEQNTKALIPERSQEVSRTDEEFSVCGRWIVRDCTKLMWEREAWITHRALQYLAGSLDSIPRVM